MDQIGGWSRAELRRFIVNEVLSDPGAYPKSQVQQSLPAGAADGNVPVWDQASSRWVTSKDHPVPASDLKNYPSDATKTLLGDGTWGKPPLAFIRAQGNFTWSAADTNFRIYSPFSTTQYASPDSATYFSVGGGKVTVQPGFYIVSIAYIHSSTVGFSAHIEAGYNDASWDGIAGGEIAIGGPASDATPYSVAGFQIANFASATVLDLGGWNNAGGSGTAVLNLIRLI